MEFLDPSTILSLTESIVDSVDDVVSGMVLEHIDGTNSIAVIAERSGLEQDLVTKIAIDLAENGRIFIPGFEEKGNESKEKSVDPISDADGVKIAKSSFAIEVGEVFKATKTANYYGLLGADVDASRKDLRTKYFALSKRFHPDRASVKDKVNAEVKHQMEVVFAKLTEAYDVLSNANKRAVYNEENSDDIEMYSIERKLRLAMAPPVDETTDEPSDDSRQKVKKASAAVNRTEASNRVVQAAKASNRVVQAAKASNRAVQAAKASSRSVVHTIKPAGGSHRLSGQSSNPPRTELPKNRETSHSTDKLTLDERRREMKRQRATQAMASMFGRNPPPQQSAPKQRKPQPNISDQIGTAEVALEQDRPSDAANIINEVLKIEPDNAAAIDVRNRAQLSQMQFRARGHIRKGKLEFRSKNFREACKHFEMAFKCDKENLDARHLLAEALLKSKNDVSRATSLVKEVIVLGGQRARYFATLGELMLLTKDLENAKKAFIQALELEPENKEYKKRLKVCGK